MKTISLRVFRRTKDNIAFLFNKEPLQEVDLTKLVIYNSTNADTKKVLEYTIDINAAANTAQVVVDHILNDISAKESYIFTFVFSKDIAVSIRVYPAEVLPVSEKDDKKQNIHLFGWEDSTNKWVKISAVKCEDGSYAIPVKIVK